MCEWDGHWKHQRPITINGKVESIDSCIVPLITALNCAGLQTIASCCGHGNQPVSVILKDDSWLLILDRKMAKEVCSLFPSINPIKEAEDV